MAEALPEIDARGLAADRLADEILPAAQPLVLRGLVDDWPAVQAGREGARALADYLRRLDRGVGVKVKLAPPKVRGRFFYDDTLTGFNYRKETMSVSAALELLLASEGDAMPAAVAVQSVQARHVLPGFELENALPVLPKSAAPRLWLGGAVTVAAHYDPADNIACVAAGQRRFTLFPPEQVRNLYPGPFELTMAGPVVSMVDFDAPDLALYPRFSEAMTAARIAELTPGDAIYIPCLWWHHVRSTAPMNLLVNYWWEAPNHAHAAGSDALLHAMLAIKGRPEPQRAAWRALFDHYVFREEDAAHLPVDRRGVQGKLTHAAAQPMREKLAQSLGAGRGHGLWQRSKTLFSVAKNRARRILFRR